MGITIKHLAFNNNWEEHHAKVETPKCLILGSFNPDIVSNSAASFYYCRLPKAGPGNRFWPLVSEELSFDANCKEDEDTRIRAMQQGKFIFMDLIDTLTVSSSNSEVVRTYLNNEISSFSDAAVWSSSSKKRGSDLIICRTYNRRIFDVLKKYQSSLQYVVFTLGPSGLNPLIKKKKNGSLSRRDKQWVLFYAELVETCANLNHLTLVTDTCSPSPQGGCSNNDIRHWLRKYVIHK
jgi:hypothetical protein